MKKKYNVTITGSNIGEHTISVVARNEDEAIERAKEIVLDDLNYELEELE